MYRLLEPLSFTNTENDHCLGFQETWPGNRVVSEMGLVINSRLIVLFLYYRLELPLMSILIGFLNY